MDDFLVVGSGNFPLEGGDVQQHYAVAKHTVHSAFQRGILPTNVSGDDVVANPFTMSFGKLSDVTFFQIDAHLGFHDDRLSVHDGCSSPMRRAVE